MSDPGWSDRRVDTIIGNLLRVGVLLAALVVLAGGGLYLAQRGSTVPDYRLFHGEPASLRGPSGILKEARELDGPGLIQLGLLLLLATPVARVAVSVVAFTLQRDPIYVAVTLIVLAVLLYSLGAGGR